MRWLSASSRGERENEDDGGGERMACMAPPKLLAILQSCTLLRPARSWTHHAGRINARPRCPDLSWRLSPYAQTHLETKGTDKCSTFMDFAKLSRMKGMQFSEAGCFLTRACAWYQCCWSNAAAFVSGSLVHVAAHGTHQPRAQESFGDIYARAVRHRSGPRAAKASLLCAEQLLCLRRRAHATVTAVAAPL